MLLLKQLLHGSGGDQRSEAAAIEAACATSIWVFVSLTANEVFLRVWWVAVAAWRGLRLVSITTGNRSGPI